MAKISVIVLADSETHGDMGPVANALALVKEDREAGSPGPDDGPGGPFHQSSEEETMAQHATNPESWIGEHLSGPQERFAEFARKVYEGGALDRKTKELIAVAASSVGRCPHCTDGHLSGAREAGATEEEIAEALAVAWVQGGGTQVVWMKDDFAEVLGEDWRQSFIQEADRAFWAFKREVYEDGALPEKTKHLIAVAASSALRCRHCTRGHMESALEAGASRKEIAEALSVLWVIGSGVEVVWSKDTFQEHLASPVHV